MSVAQIAEAEGVDVTQDPLAALTLLAPEVVERLVNTPGAALEQGDAQDLVAGVV